MYFVLFSPRTVLTSTSDLLKQPGKNSFKCLTVLIIFQFLSLTLNLRERSNAKSKGTIFI